MTKPIEAFFPCCNRFATLPKIIQSATFGMKSVSLVEGTFRGIQHAVTLSYVAYVLFIILNAKIICSCFLSYMIGIGIGKRPTLSARREIPLVIHSVMRAKAKSYQGRMDVPLRKDHSSKIASGIRMEDWVIFTFSTSRNHLHMEEFLSWTR